VLIRRERLFKELKIRHKELEKRHFELKEYLNKAHISGLITHYEKLPLYYI